MLAQSENALSRFALSELLETDLCTDSVSISPLDVYLTQCGRFVSVPIQKSRYFISTTLRFGFCHSLLSKRVCEPSFEGGALAVMRNRLLAYACAKRVLCTIRVSHGIS